MPIFLGDYHTTETVYIPFNTFSSNDPSASVTTTTLLNTDCHVHKDGGTTQRTSSAGETLSIDFDGVAGNHLLALDLSDDTHAGFYAAGSTYQVRIEGATVDAGNINAWIGVFSIGRMLRPTTAGRTLDVSVGGEAGVDWANVGSPTTSVALSGTTVGTTTANTDMRGTDSAALASVVGALTDAAAAGDPTTADTVMQYIKQLINILVGTAGVATFPAEAAPGNAVSLAEVIRAIHVDVTGLNGDVMRGTDGANTTTPTTAAANADAVWDEARAGHVGAGSFGEGVAGVQGNVTGSVGSVTGAVGSVTGAVGSVTGAVGSVVGNVDGSVASVTADVNADVVKISTSATAADNLKASTLGIIRGTAQTGTLSTVVMTTDLTGYLDDELIGRTVVWTGGTAAGQASDVTDYAAASGTVTYTAITTAPANGDTFVIV